MAVSVASKISLAN